MSKKVEFKTIEEATTAYEKAVADLAKEKEAHSTTKSELTTAKEAAKGVKKAAEDLAKEIEAHNGTKSELETAKKVAQDAIQSANEAIEKADPNIYATVSGSKYKINFGVDGLSAEELKSDKTRLAKLVKIGSGALTKVD